METNQCVAILGSVGWSINFPISNKEQNRAANVTVNSDSMTGFHTVGKYYTTNGFIFLL